MKTSDFFEGNIRTFNQRSPMFCNFRTDASLPLKFFFKKTPTLPTPGHQIPCFYKGFRVKDRV